MSWLSDLKVSRLREVAALPDIPGTRYVLHEAIGAGGMGVVYRAYDDALDREVAVKVTHAAADADLAERLRREARVLARLEHAGIVPIHDVGMLADGRLFYVMKRVHGETLTTFLRRVPDLDRRLSVFERVCETIAFAHERGIVHRDIKPDNIMVGVFGEVLVLDWGIAKVVDGDTGLTERAAAASGSTRQVAGATMRTAANNTAAGTIMGTPGFMAPEQASGVAECDRRTDVYTLGAVLYYLLMDTPAPNASPIEVLQRQKSLPRRLRAICACGLAAEPGHRYVDAAVLAEDIARYRAGKAVIAYRETVLDRIERFVTGYQTPILLVLAYLIMRLLVALIRA